MDGKRRKARKIQKKQGMAKKDGYEQKEVKKV